MTAFVYFLLVIAAAITVLFVNSLEPVSAKVFTFFAVWLLLPYGIMATFLVLLQCKGSCPISLHVVEILVVVGGLLFLADVIFCHPDAQGGIAVMMTPILQVGAMAILFPVVEWLTRKVRP